MKEHKERHFDYKDFVAGEKRGKFENRLKELVNLANSFIADSGYDEYVECNERIMMNVLIDYYSDIYRLKEFHDIELVRTEKIIAYTVAWIIKRKPLQFVKYPFNEQDIFVNERFAAYLMLNECLFDDDSKYIPGKYKDKLDEYVNLILYYFKYRECNPKVIELAIESFKMGMLVE